MARLNRFYAAENGEHALTSVVRLGRAVGMFVPSAVIRGDWNVLLNPAHADFLKIKLQEPEPFVFDTRMFR